MWGKCWITIIRNHSFHKSLHSIGCSLLFWTARAVTVTSSVFCSIKHVFIPIPLGSENSSKRTQRMAFSAAIVATLASSERVFNASPFPFKKRFAPFCQGWTWPGTSNGSCMMHWLYRLAIGSFIQKAGLPAIERPYQALHFPPFKTIRVTCLGYSIVLTVWMWHGAFPSPL